MSTPKADPVEDYSTAVPGPSPLQNVLNLKARIEALLFVASSPVDPRQLATTLETSPHAIKTALQELEQDLNNRGIRLQRHQSGFLLTTAPETSREIERFLQIESQTRLTRAALEVLAIIAYRQPITRPSIDSIRGVNSDSALRTLIRHGLVEETGRSMGPGRPILYETTQQFLLDFGLSSLDEMPKVPPELLEAVQENSTTMEDGSESQTNEAS